MAKKEEVKEDALSLALTEAGAMTSITDLLEGGAIPASVDTKEKALTIIQAGKELGIEPVTALTGIHIIKGRMVVSHSLLGALLKAHRYEFRYTKNFEPTEKDPTNMETEITLYWFSDILKREMSDSHSVTWNQMALAGYTSKPNWEKYPKEMMRARAMAYGVRAMAPEVLLGKYTDAEIVDALPNSGKEVTVDEEGETVVVDVDHEVVGDE